MTIEKASVIIGSSAKQGKVLKVKYTMKKCAVALIALLWTFSAQAETIVISSPPIPPVSGSGDQPGYLKNIIIEAGSRVGIDIRYKNQPAARSLRESNAGRSDGELHRIEGLEKHFPNLVRVPETVLIDSFVGFAARPGVKVENWDDTGSLKVYYPRGWTIYANAFGEDNEHHPGLHGHSLFHMVESGRIDFAMHTLDKGTYIADRENIKVYPVEPAFATKRMYIYLHKSKAHLVKRLASAIAEVKRDGTYSRIKKEVLDSFNLTDDAYYSSPLDKPGS